MLSGGTLDAAQIDALTAAGQLTLSEIDSTHSGAGSVSFSYSAPDSSFDFLAEGQTLTVSYTITVTDNSNVSSSQPVTFTITGSNDAPVVDAHNATLSYTENHAPAAIDAALTLSDVDSATLGSATVQISGNFVAGEDVLGFTDQNGIHGSYDAAHGILTLTGNVERCELPGRAGLGDLFRQQRQSLGRPAYHQLLGRRRRDRQLAQ